MDSLRLQRFSALCRSCRTKLLLPLALTLFSSLYRRTPRPISSLCIFVRLCLPHWQSGLQGGAGIKPPHFALVQSSSVFSQSLWGDSVFGVFGIWIFFSEHSALDFFVIPAAFMDLAEREKRTVPRTIACRVFVKI